MRRFLIYCSLFGSMVAFALLVGECIISTSSNSYRYKHNWMLENGSEVEMLIMGSSHSYYGIHPQKLSSRSFNLANVSQNFEYDFLLLKNYENRLHNLRTVILPVSYCSLFDVPFEDGNEWWYAINYKKYMDVDVHSDVSKYNFELSKMSVYSGRLMNIISGKGLPLCDSLGFGLGYTLSDRPYTWREDAYSTVERHTAANWNALDENVYFLRSIMALCREHSWNIILVTLPASHYYYNSLDSAQMGKMYQIIESVQRDFPDVKYFDFLKSDEFGDDDFFDCDHLNSIGAEKFSKILKEEIANMFVCKMFSE